MRVTIRQAILDTQPYGSASQVISEDSDFKVVPALSIASGQNFPAVPTTKNINHVLVFSNCFEDISQCSVSFPLVYWKFHFGQQITLLAFQFYGSGGAALG